ncbi:hypothetical protein [Aquabacterium sp. CECT 9606]|uniref:hypothetical protein n=1 Tax=Aquabacterium sp. CECT 9606 TaxID=2845822 RepID=UPI001E62CCD4|nr:hypothetical protein [Aquabacterium sp. CECT 9606]CAH0353596.1 hypothetical protein AQB9606_03386 [Aquabacterium sp. CECT 9606]
MPFADDIAGAGDAHSLDQGLLGSVAQWCVPVGVTQTPWIRRFGQALLLLATALLLAWAWALMSQAMSGQGSWFTTALALVIGVPWLLMAWRSWQSLKVNRVVILQWGGLPPFRAISPAAGIPPGWSLKDAAQTPAHAVAAHVVFDLGWWVLVKMVACGKGGQADTWSWLDARICFKGRAGHHLRALLYSARANQVGAEQVVASSANHQIQWSNLLSTFKTSGPVAGNKGVVRKGASVQGMAAAGSDFADTVVLVRPDPFVQQSGRA